MFYAIGLETGLVYAVANSRAEVLRMLSQEFPTTKPKECNMKTSTAIIKQILPEAIKITWRSKKMKNGKNPTRREKQHLQSLRLNGNNWLIVKKMSGEWLIIHRETGRTRKVIAP